ncbi:MAG: hypothetical protein J6T88_08310 [Bacteroidales bacterium]|nr:hypothetical protein [Bacteroidales bacterium]
MKHLIILFALMLSCIVAKAQNDTIVLATSQDTQYVLVYYSDAFVDSLVRDCGADETELDDLYTALDDYAFYLHQCSQKLDSLGIKYLQADNDTRIYLREEKRWLTLPYRNFVGVLVYVRGKEPEWLDVFNWLSR